MNDEKRVHVWSDVNSIETNLRQCISFGSTISLRLSNTDRTFKPIFLSFGISILVLWHIYEQRTHLSVDCLSVCQLKEFSESLEENPRRLQSHTFYSNEFVCTRANGTRLRKCKVIRIRIHNFNLRLI